MKTWVVMTARDGTGWFWAWCEPSPEGPGFSHVFYTNANGIDAYEPPDNTLPMLHAHVFTVQLPEEADQSRETFPDEPEQRPGWRQVAAQHAATPVPEPDRADPDPATLGAGD